VLDIGCGPARLAAYLADNKKVSHYTGIEYAHSMVKLAESTLQQIARPKFKVHQQKIEDFKLTGTEGRFSSAVSLQSYYAWDNPVQTLIHVFSLLQPGAVFVLATVNHQLDQKKLFHEAKKDLMWHPDFEAFKASNLALADNPQTRYVTMDELVRQVHSAGFKIINCHQEHYAGGLNFLVCCKPDS
jgi:SAM-dependent methyltransferase